MKKKALPALFTTLIIISLGILLPFTDWLTPARKRLYSKTADTRSEEPRKPKNVAPPNLEVDSESGLSLSTANFLTNKGSIRFKFYSRDAPRSIERISKLISSGYYDGLPFHRVISNFIVQTGSPDGTPYGGTGSTLSPEFNDRHHIEGTIGMARSQDPESADAQIYFCLKRSPQLDGKYTVIGQVTQGFETLRKLQLGDRISQAWFD